MKFGFVILHYQELNETIACVNSIVDKFKDEEYIICIVDNCSPNKTGEQLIDVYQNTTNIHVVNNRENLGFSKGLNVGINYLRTKNNLDFILLLNNDTEILSDNWTKSIEKKFIKYNFAVMGPDIVSIDEKIHANPVKQQVNNIKELEKLILNKKFQYIKNLLYIPQTIVVFKNILKKIMKYKSKIITKDKVEQDVLNTQLQGSCLILSSVFFENYTGLYSETFLYFEEAILKYYCDRKSLISMYNPDIILLHKESVSTKKQVKGDRARKIFYLKHSLESCKLLLKIMNEDAEIE